MTAIPVRQNRIALNAIQWINIKADPTNPDSEDLWRYADPTFRADYPGVLAEIRRSGFSAVMMEVLATQTLQDFGRMIADSGLELAPGYVGVPIPRDHGVTLAKGTGERIRWFDLVRRRAEESNTVGLETVFIAPEVSWEPGFVRTLDAVGVGAGFDQGRLDEQIEFVGEAASILQAEGVRAGLHNHVGTWIETEDEIEQTLAAIPADLLGASFDIGHLAWAGIDPVEMIMRHSDRVVDLHIKDLDMAIADASRETPTSYRKATDSGIFLEPGLGTLDIVGSLAALPADFDGWVIVEVDRASMDPSASADVSWKWVAENVPA
ncbi:inosose dehydratase [Frondihabitans sp. PhB188]|uniref:sugar phosphate isomerase/epimerase family protein n=1 Tax=Frondihabitans sp. PhB188 TaxID=2485200 RepID=UPI000F495BBA|nr:sugar phosphate isomerase/epimerase [Frondihabitans sp. PhB188]ROQ37152.1 inosose dehydratase [Frondihabitans sp. PhB188]